MNTIRNQNLFDLISTFDNVAKIPALRGIVHSTMAKAIGSIRQHLREQARAERDAENPQVDLDVRNQHDEDNRAPNDFKEAVIGNGGTREAPLFVASRLHAVYDVANDQLQTVLTSKWDAPLTPEAMLAYMTDKAQSLPEAVVIALADAAKTTPAVIRTMHELQDRQEREQLKLQAPTILGEFKSFGAGWDDAIDELDAVTRHQLGVKVVEALTKARDGVLSRVMRTRKLTDLASVPLLEAAIKDATAWVEDFETVHLAEIREAIDAGRNIRSVEDISSAL